MVIKHAEQINNKQAARKYTVFKGKYSKMETTETVTYANVNIMVIKHAEQINNKQAARKYTVFKGKYPKVETTETVTYANSM
jgi:predicted metallo-beta-lactamase superfamily hydrolase